MPYAKIKNLPQVMFGNQTERLLHGQKTRKFHQNTPATGIPEENHKNQSYPTTSHPSTSIQQELAYPRDTIPMQFWRIVKRDFIINYFAILNDVLYLF